MAEDGGANGMTAGEYWNAWRESLGGYGGPDSAIAHTGEAVSEFGNALWERVRNPTNTSITDGDFLQDSYDFRYRVFPEDLTNNDVGHYMVININTPTEITGSGTPRTFYDGSEYRTTVLRQQYSKVDVLRFGPNGGPATNAKPLRVNDATGLVPSRNDPNIFKNFTTPPASEGLVFPRGTRRIKESIALFMPTPVIYSTVNAYEEQSLTSLAGSVVTGLASAIPALAGAATGGTIGMVAGSEFGSSLGGAIDKSMAALGTAASLAKYPINPRIEVLYVTTPTRQFVFEFLMAPKSKKESWAMEEIIHTLRLHAAPEVDPLFAGLTWIPPAEFDITFFNKGVENTTIPRINTCVLNRIDVDYAPNGVYATFSNGHPVACRLTLAFQEVEVIHKRRVLQGF